MHTDKYTTRDSNEFISWDDWMIQMIKQTSWVIDLNRIYVSFKISWTYEKKKTQKKNSRKTTKNLV